MTVRIDREAQDKGDSRATRRRQATKRGSRDHIQIGRWQTGAMALPNGFESRLEGGKPSPWCKEQGMVTRHGKTCALSTQTTGIAQQCLRTRRIRRKRGSHQIALSGRMQQTRGHALGQSLPGERQHGSTGDKGVSRARPAVALRRIENKIATGKTR